MSDNKTNIGNRNSGNWNSGDCNSGYCNSGDCNSGDFNSANCNSGDCNSGNRNSANCNSGNWNSGNWNSGYCNSGNRNSGYCNSGDFNSGYGNSTDRSSGIFCNQAPKVISFNKPTDIPWHEINHPKFYEFRVTKWIPEEYMTDREKAANKGFHVVKGYLKTYTYKEAWANYWRDTTEDDRQRVLNLPNFDAEVFKDITGIEVEDKNKDYSGKIVEIDGVEYELKRIS